VPNRKVEFRKFRRILGRKFLDKEKSVNLELPLRNLSRDTSPDPLMEPNQPLNQQQEYIRNPSFYQGDAAMQGNFLPSSLVYV